MSSGDLPVLTVVEVSGTQQAVCSAHGPVAVWRGVGAEVNAAFSLLGHAAAHHRPGRPVPGPLALDRVQCSGCGLVAVVMDGVVCAGVGGGQRWCRRPGGWRLAHGPWLPAAV